MTVASVILLMSDDLSIAAVRTVMNRIIGKGWKTLPGIEKVAQYLLQLTG
jgi:hypothetical protein